MSDVIFAEYVVMLVPVSGRVERLQDLKNPTACGGLWFVHIKVHNVYIVWGTILTSTTLA